MDALAQLRPAFKEDGKITAGNSSQITDGAAALLAMSARRAREFGMEPLGRLREYAVTGCSPRRMGLGPVGAIGKVLEKAGMALDSADIIEINEAFATQVLAVMSKLEADGVGKVEVDRLNRCGGAIALGHPVGASGARLALTALKQLRRRNSGGGRAIVSLCVGGGQGVAALLEAG